MSRRQDKIKETILICDICEYPFKTQENLNSHKEKHKNETEECETNQTCGICSTEFSSNNEFRNHIKIKHITQFNCENCDFQGSSKIILTKYLNLKHRNKEDQENGTLICSNCKDQFSSLWNLNNHMRDTHTKTQVCKWFEDGHCRFPESECWNKHDKSQSIQTNLAGDIKCQERLQH